MARSGARFDEPLASKPRVEKDVQRDRFGNKIDVLNFTGDSNEYKERYLTDQAALRAEQEAKEAEERERKIREFNAKKKKADAEAAEQRRREAEAARLQAIEDAKNADPNSIHNKFKKGLGAARSKEAAGADALVAKREEEKRLRDEMLRQEILEDEVNRKQRNALAEQKLKIEALEAQVSSFEVGGGGGGGGVNASKGFVSAGIGVSSPRRNGSRFAPGSNADMAPDHPAMKTFMDEQQGNSYLGYNNTPQSRISGGGGQLSESDAMYQGFLQREMMLGLTPERSYEMRQERILRDMASDLGRGTFDEWIDAKNKFWAEEQRRLNLFLTGMDNNWRETKQNRVRDLYDTITGLHHEFATRLSANNLANVSVMDLPGGRGGGSPGGSGMQGSAMRNRSNVFAMEGQGSFGGMVRNSSPAAEVLNREPQMSAYQRGLQEKSRDALSRSQSRSQMSMPGSRGSPRTPSRPPSAGGGRDGGMHIDLSDMSSTSPHHNVSRSGFNSARSMASDGGGGFAPAENMSRAERERAANTSQMEAAGSGRGQLVRQSTEHRLLRPSTSMARLPSPQGTGGGGSGGGGGGGSRPLAASNITGKPGGGGMDMASVVLAASAEARRPATARPL